MGFERSCWWNLFCRWTHYNSSISHYFRIPAGVPRHLFPSPRDPRGIRRVPVIHIPVQLLLLYWLRHYPFPSSGARYSGWFFLSVCLFFCCLFAQLSQEGRSYDFCAEIHATRNQIEVAISTRVTSNNMYCREGRRSIKPAPGSTVQCMSTSTSSLWS